jgi:RNA polymerase sigma-70 factor (ECF subfamily)
MDRPGSGGGDHGDLERALFVGRQRWPALALDRDVLSAYLRARVPAGAAVSDETLGDLYMACACLANVPGALAAFNGAYLAAAPALTRSYDPSPAFADDVCQKVREALFVAKNGTPAKIAQYDGEGPLARWVAVSVTRAALRLSKSARRESPADDEVLASALKWSKDGESVLLKAELREAFKQAFAAALRELSPKHRLALKLNVVRGVNTTAIAKMNNVNQSTISRWIKQAREQILAATRSALAASLKISGGELESVLVAVRSQVDLNLSQLLGGSTVATKDRPSGQPPR